MKPGDYIRMINVSTLSDYAQQYCKRGGLQKGTICIFDSILNDSTVRLKTTINGVNLYTEVGTTFLKEHFELSKRMINLNTLIN